MGDGPKRHQIKQRWALAFGIYPRQDDRVQGFEQTAAQAWVFYRSEVVFGTLILNLFQRPGGEVFRFVGFYGGAIVEAPVVFILVFLVQLPQHGLDDGLFRKIGRTQFFTQAIDGQDFAVFFQVADVFAAVDQGFEHLRGFFFLLGPTVERVYLLEGGTQQTLVLQRVDLLPFFWIVFQGHWTFG